jgi:hypothetical protein
MLQKLGEREVQGLGGVAEDQAWLGGSPGAFIGRGKVGLVALAGNARDVSAMQLQASGANLRAELASRRDG